MYTVGQVLYLVMQNRMKILPVQVSEEITKKTLGGEKTEYFVSAPGEDTFINLEEFDGQIFSNLPEVKSFLLENVTQNLNKIIEKADLLAQEHFSSPEIPEVSEKENFTNPQSPIPEEGELIQVDLGDGKTATMRM